MPANDNPLIRLIYVSVARDAGDAAMLPAVLEKSRRNNAARNITGLLATCGDQFFQVLEGHQDVVGALFKRICADSRHTGVVMLVQEEIVQRAFGAWSMAHFSVNSADLNRISDVNTFLELNDSLNQPRGVMVRAVLQAFIKQVRASGEAQAH